MVIQSKHCSCWGQLTSNQRNYWVKFSEGFQIFLAREGRYVYVVLTGLKVAEVVYGIAVGYPIFSCL